MEHLILAGLVIASATLALVTGHISEPAFIGLIGGGTGAAGIGIVKGE